MTSLRVRNLMREKVLAVRPDDDLATVHDLMLDHAVRHVPVVDEDGSLVGMISHRDLLRSALIEQPDLPPYMERSLLEAKRARELMSPYVETVAPDDALADAARRMLESKLGSLPVTDDGHLVGILTEADFVRAIADAA